MGFSLVVESRGYSLVAVHRLLILMASLVVAHSSRARGLSSCGSQAPEHRLNSYVAHGAAQHVGSSWIRD